MLSGLLLPAMVGKLIKPSYNWEMVSISLKINIFLRVPTAMDSECFFLIRDNQL